MLYCKTFKALKIHSDVNYHISLGNDHMNTVSEKSMWKYQEDVKTEKR